MNTTNNDIKVSIICNAFNHEKYIEKALRSFISQNTNFKFEVLVHDDASTDNTAEIIKRFEEQYPDIIYPIYQTRNQYSLGVDITHSYQTVRARGKYIAFCEGDDYWISNEKLQTQYELMEKNPDIDMCAHSVLIVNEQGESTGKKIQPNSGDSILSTNQVIRGGGGYLGTNSLFYRKELENNIPNFRENMNYDYTMQIHGSLKGGIYFLEDCFSAYRSFSNNSWTSRMQTDYKLKNNFRKNEINMLTALNQYTSYRYIMSITYCKFILLLKILFTTMRKR